MSINLAKSRSYCRLQLRRLALATLVLAFMGLAVPCSWGQSIEIVSIFQLDGEDDELYFDGDQIKVTWIAHCGCSETVRYGTDAQAVLDDGSYYQKDLMNVGSASCGDYHYATIVQNLDLYDVPCSHQFRIRAMVQTGNTCEFNDLVEVFSPPVTVWIDDMSTPLIEDGKPGTCAPPTCEDDTTVGGPVSVVNGKMYYETTDLSLGGPIPIRFSRRYDSQSDFNGTLGYGWQHAYMVRLEGTGSIRTFVNREMRPIRFSRDPFGNWTPNRLDNMTLIERLDGTWQVANKHQRKWDFDASGTLTKISDKNGNEVILTYTGSELTAVTDDLGRGISLTYSSGRVHTVSAGGLTATYTYNGTTSNLEQVDWSDGSFQTYEYTDPFDDHNLTAVKDSYGEVIEEHTYDSSDRVSVTQEADGNYEYELSYDSSTQTTVTNSLDIDTVYTIDDFSGLVTASTGPECSQCGSSTDTTLEYDEHRNLTKIIDASSIVTEMTYDDKGNVLTRTEAVGTPRERTYEFTYDPTFNFQSTSEIPTVGNCTNSEKVKTTTYDPSTGDQLTEEIVGCAGDDIFSSTTTYTYDSRGRLQTIDGSRTDVSDVTTYEYYSDSDPDVNLRGRLHWISNALGHQTTFTSYDLFGNVLSQTDPNNVETQFTYDAKGRLTETRIVGSTPADDIVTEQRYDNDGKLAYVRLPNCVEAGVGCAYSTDYVYDSSGRVKETIDPYGNKIVYTYDSAGNKTREEYRDSLDVIKSFTNYSYDDYNRLEYVYYNDIIPEATGSVFTKFTYYADGLRESMQDPEGHVTSYEYDELKRLTTVSQTVGVDAVNTEYGYDHQDNLSSVMDPNSFTTTYTSHDMGWRLQTISPDTGTTTYGYDLAGNLTSATDANGVTSNRTYDALNRMSQTSYPDTSLNVTPTYDSTAVTFGIGRRTGITDASGISEYEYDRRGLLKQEDKTINGDMYTTQYEYDKTGNLEQILYPTSDPVERQGQVDYAYDYANRIVSITTMVNGSPATVASSFTYEPFGPRKSVTFGNSLIDSRTYGSRYQLGNWTLGGLLSYTHLYDDDLNMTDRTDNLNSVNNRVFDYDELHRLTTASGPWGPGTECAGGVTYTYDLNGNRLCKGENSPATNCTYLANANQLSGSTGGEIASYSHDSNGNMTGDGSQTYEYSDANRLESVDSGATANYIYDAEGRRVAKTVSGTTSLFFYDPYGNLLSEIDTDLNRGKDYIYSLDTPIGRVDWTSEQDLGNLLKVGESPPNVHLDWSLYPSSTNDYVVRRKQVTDPSDKTFSGSIVIATVSDPTQAYDDPVYGSGNDYDYRVFRLAAEDTLYFYHTDHIGTPIAVTDELSNLVWKAERRPFGSVYSLTTDDTKNALSFPGQYFDEETQFHQNWHRDYAANLGRYTQSDPVGLAGGVNLYAYVSNSPTNFSDPLGLWKRGDVIYRCCREDGCDRKNCDVALIWYDPNGAGNRNAKAGGIRILAYGDSGKCENCTGKAAEVTLGDLDNDPYADFEIVGTSPSPPGIKDKVYEDRWKKWRTGSPYGQGSNPTYRDPSAGFFECTDFVNYMRGTWRITDYLFNHDLNYWNGKASQ